MIQYCIEDAVAAGITQICVVVAPWKTSIRDFLLSGEMLDKPAFHARESTSELLAQCEFSFVTQLEPIGIADAVLRARDFIASSPFTVLFPDSILFDHKPALAQMADCFERGSSNVLALYQLSRTEAHRFGKTGLNDSQRLKSRLFRITALHGKETGYQDHPCLVVFGPMVFTSDYLAIAATNTRENSDELDDGPVIRRLITTLGVTGYLLEGQAFDVGNPRGYAAANSWLRTRTTSTPLRQGENRDR